MQAIQQDTRQAISEARNQPGGARRLRLAYAEASRDLVAPLSRALEAAGFSVHWAQVGPAETDAAIDAADAVLVCWTPAAVASDAVNIQAARARQARKLVHILLAPCSPPASLGGRLETSDLSSWRGDPSEADFLALVHSLHARLSGRVFSSEFWRSRLYSWGGAGALSLAGLTLLLNFGDLRQTFDGVFNPAASERTLRVTSANVEEVLKLIKQQSTTPLDAAAESSMRESIARLLSAQDGARGAAADKLLNGDRDGAITDLESAAAQGERAVLGLAETWKEIGFLTYSDRTVEAISAFERASALAPEDWDTRIQLGHLYVRTGQLDDAYDSFFEVDLGLSDRNDPSRAVALMGLAQVDKTRRNFAGANVFLQEALDLNRQAGDRLAEADALGALGQVAELDGDLNAAERLFRQSLAIHEEIGDVQGQAIGEANLGSLARQRGDLATAETYIARALSLNTELGNINGQAVALAQLGLIAEARGEIDKAERFFLDGHALNQQVGDSEGLAIGYSNLASIARKRGDSQAAIGHLQQAREIYLQMGLYEDVDWTERELMELGLKPSPEGPER